MAKLPEQFCEKMKNLLQDEYDEFINGYDNENYYSLRVNTLKGTKGSFVEKNMFSLRPVQWCDSGFYYDNKTRPGRHRYHHAGVYYIQEASAMAPVSAAEIQPGDKVLDLCAAPGGKSTQAACRLNGTGLLVSNEIVPSRAKILSGNIERMGVKNAVVLNENPADMEKYFPAFFDKIIIILTHVKLHTPFVFTQFYVIFIFSQYFLCTWLFFLVKWMYIYSFLNKNIFFNNKFLYLIFFRFL